MKGKRLLIAGAVVVLVVATALAVTLSLSSSSTPSSDGPFGPSGVTIEDECVQIPGQVLTYGFEFVENYGKSGATIQGISYVNPSHLQVLQTFTIPVRNHELYGGRWGYPPQWMLAQRTSLIRPGHQYNVILVTKLMGQAGHADAVLVNYTEGGTQYLLRTITALDVKRQPLQC